jgi:hypothetical protein
VTAHRAGALERVQLLLEDWQHAHRRLLDTETRMTGVLDELELTTLVTTITGLSAVGAAAILAQTGDPRRFATARALVKHAGLAPRERLSGAFVGRAKLTGQGRPGLRLAAWRAVWGAQRANAVYGARYRHLTAREHNRLKPTQAQTVIAAAILRHLHAVITTGRPGTRPSPRTAPNGHSSQPPRPDQLVVAHKQAVGASPTRHRDTRRSRRTSWAAPPVVSPTRSHAAGPQPHSAMQGQTTDEAPTAT